MNDTSTTPIARDTPDDAEAPDFEGIAEGTACADNASTRDPSYADPSACAELRTRTVRAGIATDPHHGAVVPPIHLTSTFTFDGFDGKRAYDYTRTGNPTRDLLAGALAELEGGFGAVVTSSGMSAVALVLQLLEPGDLLVAPHDCYGGTFRAMASLAERGRFRIAFVDQSDAAALEQAFERDPRMLWVETPSNPLLRITDLTHAAALARAHGTLLVADNTFLTPLLQRPIDHGADIVVHSTTKYLNGHSDVVGGAAICRTETLHQELADWANCLGLSGAPFDAFMTLRGLRTLHARMAAHQQNALAIVGALAEHEAVARVHHPSLAQHPGHDVARRQQTGFGAMVSFELVGGEAAVRAFLDGLRHFSLAESLGGVESLVSHPVTMTHASMDEASRRAAGISDGLLRLSVGIEGTRDLVRDVEAGLERACV
jgi:cystathionine gamma-synthase